MEKPREEKLREEKPREENLTEEWYGSSKRRNRNMEIAFAKFKKAKSRGSNRVNMNMGIELYCDIYHECRLLLGSEILPALLSYTEELRSLKGFGDHLGLSEAMMILPDAAMRRAEAKNARHTRHL